MTFATPCDSSLSCCERKERPVVFVPRLSSAGEVNACVCVSLLLGRTREGKIGRSAGTGNEGNEG